MVVGGYVVHMREEKSMHSLGEKTSRHRWAIIYWLVRKRVRPWSQWWAVLNVVINLLYP